MFVSENGQVFTWGWGETGQLGHGDLENRFEPTLLESMVDQNILKVVCGHDHSLLLNDRGELFAFGKYAFWEIQILNFTSQICQH